MKAIKDKILNTRAKNQWEIIGIKHHHGINIPLSSIHTQKSCGIGEFYDLIPLIDWCEELGLDVIQILPINDCGTDPSPYNAISASALNPNHLSLHKLPYLDKHPKLKKKIETLQTLTQSPRIAYPEVQTHKMTWLREYINSVAEHIMKTKSFCEFVAKNGWVEPYALFKVLKDHCGQYQWTTWPKEFKEPSHDEYEKLVEYNFNEMAFYILVQYLCFKQLIEVKKYANAHNVFLKGDIPILVNLDSADVWHEPHLFDTSLSAGAPPDHYNSNGQHWGFPLYNWEMMRDSHCAWWRHRLQVATPLYDIFRLDHVLGFFRIWGIPHGAKPSEGRFIPEDELECASHGKTLLEMILDATPMMPIGEDLGAIMPLVPHTLQEIGICGTRVMRWERKWETKHDFIPIKEYTPFSLTSVSTHDSETLSLWWRDCSDEAKAFCKYKKWDYEPELSNDKKMEILWESHHSASLFHINLFPEYLSLFPEMVWPSLENERINIPGTFLPTNWTYRLRLSLEEITAHPQLKETMHALITSTKPPKGP